NGVVRSEGFVDPAGAVAARFSVSAVEIHALPAGRASAGDFVRGRLHGGLVGRREASGALRAAGDLRLEGATFPVLDRARAPPSRYGLRPPNEDAQAPVTARVAVGEWGLVLRDVVLVLRGATARGEAAISRLHAL